ncbi:MAG: hypothetical protein Q9219_004852 [cf. Caloplaca sp. 3 TL-2023]
MPDTAALAALVVAAVALVVAAGQLSQQLLATAYVIRKCDQIVSGGLTKGGSRQWHWRQFRFTVRYQAIIFALPQRIHSSLGISSTIQIEQPQRDICENALKTRPQRKSTQACWVSLVQDLAMSDCLRPEDLSVEEESADRIPDDLTVAPTRVDCMSVLLSYIAMGMQVFKYSPTTGEITLAGGAGSISSSIHPILGGLLHYHVFTNKPGESLDGVKRHGHALRQESGVWANAVFGYFRDRSYRPEMVAFQTLMERKFPILGENGWLRDGADTQGGAAGFLAFGHVDAYEMVPPSVVRSWTAYFAEVIVKAHHVELLKSKSEANEDIADIWNYFDYDWLEKMLNYHGSSSPHHADVSFLPDYIDNYFKHSYGKKVPKVSLLVQYKGLLEYLAKFETIGGKLIVDSRDPSDYCSPSVSWKLLCLIDKYLNLLYERIPSHFRTITQDWSEALVATSICTLSDVGAPSWGRASEILDKWPQTLATCCDSGLKRLDTEDDRKGSGSVLITSRDPLAKSFFTAEPSGLDLDPFTTEDGASLLKKLTLNIKDSELFAERISSSLGGLPLAISQISGVIRRQDLRLPEFLESYEDASEQAGLHQEKYSVGQSNYPFTISTVWAFDSLDVSTLNLLGSLSLLDPDAIPELMFSDLPSELSLAEFPAKPTAYRKARTELLQSSLVNRHPDKNNLIIHRLVQDAFKAKMSPGNRATTLWFTRGRSREIIKILELALRVCVLCDDEAKNSVFVDTHFALSAITAGANDHDGSVYHQKCALDAQLEIRRREDVLDVHLSRYYNELGTGRKEGGDLQGSIEAFLESLSIDKQLGVYPYDWVPEANRGLSYTYIGNLAEAGIVLTGTLERRETKFGKDDTESYRPGRILHALARLREAQGQPQEPFGLYSRSLRSLMATLGPHHHFTADCGHKVTQYAIKYQ